MATLGAALARGLSGYARGRQEREAEDYARGQQDLARQRQDAKDAQAQEYQQFLMRQATEQMQRQRAQDGIAAEGRMNAARADGLRPVEEAQSVGGALATGAGFGSLGGPMGAAGGALAQYGRAMQDGAKRPDATINGRGMVRTAESNDERTTRLDNQTKRGEMMLAQEAQQKELAGIVAQLPPAFRMKALAGGMGTARMLLETQLKQQMTPKAPAAPRQPLSKVAPDGNMYYSEDGGRSWRRAQIEGMEQGGSQPTPMQDAPQSQRVPAMQGDSILRGLNLPMEANRTNAQPPRTPAPFGQTTGGPFAKPKAAPQKYVDQVMALDEMDALLDQYEASLGNIQSASVFAGRDPAMIEAQATHRQLLMAAKKAFELGVLNGKDQELIEQAISPPTGIGAVVRTKPNIVKQIGVARRSNALKREGMNRAYGQFPVEAPRLPAGAIPPDTWNEE